MGSMFNTNFLTKDLKTLQKDIDECLEHCLGIIGRRFVRHTKTYITNKWYKTYKPSSYDRTIDGGSFLDSINYVVERNGDGSVSLYIYSDTRLMTAERASSSDTLGRHTDMQGRDVRENIGDYINDGLYMPFNFGRDMRKIREGIDWVGHIQKYGEKKFNDDLLKELKRRGIFI